MKAGVNLARPLPAQPDEPEGPEFDLRFLFREHLDFVARSLLAHGIDSSGLDDAVQETLFVIHRRLSTYDPARPLRSWIYGISRNVARSLRRAHRRRPTTPILELVDPSLGVEELVARREAAAVVSAFVRKLSQRLADVFVLSEVHGLSGPEVAEALGVELNTVYSRLSRARRKFEAHARRVREA